MRAIETVAASSSPAGSRASTRPRSRLVTGASATPSTTRATTATERDLGRANIGQPSGPDNEFVWTISNGGDLPSGALGVTNANPADFDVTAETCSTAAVAGAGTCTVTIVFAPDAAGDRSTTVSVTDGGGQSVALQVTGFGVQLAAPREACLTTNYCMSGVCTVGVS